VRTLFLAAMLASGCGALDKKEDEAKPAETGDVEFSGFVQKAFTIKVNGKEFADSEQFYTRFIDELVKPAYPDLAPKDVKVEGKYGLEEFGSNSKVFMSSVAADGHLYEGRTDAASKFTIKVQAKALDETYKARVVVRIGLEINQDGAPARYCYILHGNRDGVAVSESSKPIIFDDFKTQLTTYRCEDVQENTIVLPGVEGGSPKDGEAPKAKPSAKVISTVKIQLSLAAKYEGGEKLTAVASSGAELLLARSAARDKESGKWCWPVVKLSNLSAPTLTTTCVGETADDLRLVAGIESLLAGDTVLATRGGKLSSFAPDGSAFQSFDVAKQTHNLLRVGDKVRLLDGRESCELDAIAVGQCVPAPANTCDLGLPKTMVAHAGGLLMANGRNSQGSGYCGAMAIHATSESLAYTKSYAVNPMEVSQQLFSESKLLSMNNELYLVSLVGDELQVRRVTLTD